VNELVCFLCLVIRADASLSFALQFLVAKRVRQVQQGYLRIEGEPSG
jgi:hypothetical protein